MSVFLARSSQLLAKSFLNTSISFHSIIVASQSVHRHCYYRASVSSAIFTKKYLQIFNGNIYQVFKTWQVFVTAAFNLFYLWRMRTARDSKVIYKDIPFFLILIPFVNALNYYLTYDHIPFNWHTVLTFTIDTIQGYLAWLVIRSIIIFLDKKISYQPDPVKRILFQLLLTSLAGLATIIITTEILNVIASDKPIPSGFFSFDIFIFLIWFFVINGIYIGWHYYSLWNESEKLRTEEKKIRQDGFIVKQGKQNLNITIAEIAAIYVEGNYSMLLTFDLKKHLLDQSLDKVEKQLPEELFFRVNRQYILQRKIISGFESADNGKINILTNDHFSETIQISRTKAAAFRSWFTLEN